MVIQDEIIGKMFFLGFVNVINVIWKCFKFVFGWVQGKVIGGGVGLVLVIDYCVVIKFVVVKFSELVIGIGLFVVGLVVV